MASNFPIKLHDLACSKEEVVRAGIAVLAKLPDAKLRDTLASLSKPKVGRKKLNTNLVK